MWASVLLYSELHSEKSSSFHGLGPQLAWMESIFSYYFILFISLSSIALQFPKGIGNCLQLKKKNTAHIHVGLTCGVCLSFSAPPALVSLWAYCQCLWTNLPRPSSQSRPSCALLPILSKTLSDFVTALHFYQFHLDCKLPKDTNYTHLYFLCCYDSQIWWGTYLKCDSMILAIKDGSGRTRMRSGTCLLFPDKYSQETVALGVHRLDTENHSLLNLAGT